MAHAADQLSFATVPISSLLISSKSSPRVVGFSSDQLKPGTNFHWWPKPDSPASSAGNLLFLGSRAYRRGPRVDPALGAGPCARQGRAGGFQITAYFSAFSCE